MGQTSIPCNTEVRDRLAGDKPDNMSWSEYLSVLHSDQELTVERGQTIDIEDSRLLAEHVERALAPYFADLVGVDDASKIREASVADDNSVNYDDAKNACAAALREELPDEVLQR